MRPSCAGRGCRPTPSAGHQQFSLLVDLDAHPALEVTAARALLLVIEELRCEGIVVHQVRLELDG